MMWPQPPECWSTMFRRASLPLNSETSQVTQFMTLRCWAFFVALPVAVQTTFSPTIRLIHVLFGVFPPPIRKLMILSLDCERRRRKRAEGPVAFVDQVGVDQARALMSGNASFRACWLITEGRACGCPIAVTVGFEIRDQ